MIVAAAAVVFAGILNGGHDIDKQVKPIMADLHVKPIAVPAQTLRALAHHDDATADVVRGLHVSGVIAFELAKEKGARTLKLVVYRGDGGLETYSELWLGPHGLSKDDVDVLRANLADEVTSMAGAQAPDPEPERVAAAPAPPPHPAPAVHVRLAAATPPPKPSDDAIEMDDSPPGLGPAPAARPAEHEAKPTETADASDSVSADEIAAMTGGSDPADTGTASAQASASAAEGLRIGASAGLGIATRSFTPGMATLAGYSSSAVGAVSLEAHVQPIARMELGVSLDHTLDMTTPMPDKSVASTSISRWEAFGSYALVHGASFELAARLGAGRRSFAIDSVDTARTPDTDYQYVILGASAGYKLGDRLSLHGVAAFEPVFAGNEPTEAAFGAASRWALDLAASIRCTVTSHLFVSAAAEYQQFTWSWSMAGARGAGGASDAYPSGVLALGADY
ncbi:MAG TPA: hypothetical protein VLX92_11830 [Kofleriaceae bacterium]|nr:hypothetical protein [Kofleriaceae bacterium]